MIKKEQSDSTFLNQDKLFKKLYFVRFVNWSNIDFVLKPCDSYGSVLDWQWLLFPVISDKRSSTAANFVGSNMTSEVGKQLKWTIWRFDDVANQMSLRYLVFSFLEEKKSLIFSIWIDFESQILVLFNWLALCLFTKYNDLLLLCWFLAKDISDFVFLFWKLVDRYWHNLHTPLSK